MPETSHHARARLLLDPRALAYDLDPEHLMQPYRLQALIDLLEMSGVGQHDDASVRLRGRAATLEELCLVHTSDYVAAVQRLSTAQDAVVHEEEREERAQVARRYGFAAGDTPVLPEMHEVSARIAGGTLVALRAVMGLPEGTLSQEDEHPLHVFHPAGGRHHAWADRASGYCVYNDAAIAIAHLLQVSPARVLYIDFDAHHGDGVQRAFYDDPRVMTVSFHETGRSLFPGTGDILEIGQGTGRGYSVNLPLEPFTGDNSYIEVMHAVLPPLVASFAPDVIVSQHGCDTHAWHPLSHLHLTMRGIQAQFKAVHGLAHTYCGGRWVALGGGGSDPYHIIARAWAALWAEMSEQPLPEHLPEAWVARWRPVWQAMHAREEERAQLMGKPSVRAIFPTTFDDQPQDVPEQPRRESINQANRRTAALARHLFVSPAIRQAFATERRQSLLTGLADVLRVTRTNTPSRTKVLEAPMGTVLLRDFCPPSLVARLRAESGLHAFTNVPEREHALLLDIANSSDCALTLAYTPAGEIVGQVTLTPADGWWKGVENLYEVATEVSSHWRGGGIARQLLAFALELDALEEVILFATGLSWHWDMEGLGISPRRYRKLIAHLFAAQGFEEYSTAEPDISMEPANILLARIGKRVDQRVAAQFLRRLRSSPYATQW